MLIVLVVVVVVVPAHRLAFHGSVQKTQYLKLRGDLNITVRVKAGIRVRAGRKTTLRVRTSCWWRP